MLALRQAALKSFLPISGRPLSTLSIDQFGVPSKVIKYDGKAAASKSARSDEVSVKVLFAPVLLEDARAVRGISLNNTSSGIIGSTAIGKSTDSGHLVFVSDAKTWADTILASKHQVHNLESLTAEDAVAIPAFVSAWAILKKLNASSGDVIVQSDGDSAVGQSLVQLGKSHGINVVSASKAELADPSFVQNMKSKGSIKGCVIGSSGKHVHSFLKLLPHDGKLVAYHGIYQSLDSVNGVDVPIGRAIFNGTKIHGFDYHSWIRTSPEQFAEALNDIQGLIKEKKISLKATIYDAADFNKAIGEVEKTGKLGALKF